MVHHISIAAGPPIHMHSPVEYFNRGLDFVVHLLNQYRVHRFDPALHHLSRCSHPTPTQWQLRYQSLQLVNWNSELIQSILGIRNDERSLTLLTKISWVFYNLANPIAIAITATFWGALYDYSKFPKEVKRVCLSTEIHALHLTGTPMKPQEFLFHAVNSIAVVLDLFVGARPFFLLHVYQPFCVMFCYCTFTVVYWAAGGVGAEGEHWIYPIIDWDDPGNTSLVVVLMFLMLIPLQGVMWGVHLLRDLIYRKFVKKFDCNVVGLVAENKTFEE